MRLPAIRSTANRITQTMARAVQVLAADLARHRSVAIASSTAKGAFRHSSQRKGGCTKRNFGRCSHRRWLKGSMTKAVAAPHDTSTVQALRLRSASLVLRANHTAAARSAISADATIDTSRLKRL